MKLSSIENVREDDKNCKQKKEPEFLYNDVIVREILLSNPEVKKHKEKIKTLYKENVSEEERVEYIKSLFTENNLNVILKNEETAGYEIHTDTLWLWTGKVSEHTAEIKRDWNLIESYFKTIYLLHELEEENLFDTFSGESQLSFFPQEKEKKTFVLPESFIEAALSKGSFFCEGKNRIYKKLTETSSDCSKFLSDEYGIGGSFPIIYGSGIGANYNSSGYSLCSNQYTATYGLDVHLDFTWKEVEKKIRRIIAEDKYFDLEEKELYKKWVQEQENKKNTNCNK